MKNYFVTFGIKYAREAHPKLGIVHPNGYFKIVAESEDKARYIANEYIGQHYASLYPESHFDPSPYPMGQLLLIHQDQLPVFDVWIWAEHIVKMRAGR